jgi:hypothetical protein
MGQNNIYILVCGTAQIRHRSCSYYSSQESYSWQNFTRNFVFQEFCLLGYNAVFLCNVNYLSTDYNNYTS